MRKRLRKLGTRVAAFSLALYMLATPAFALVREVEVFGAKSINDMGNSDHRVDMDGLKDEYSDFVQTDTLREYFHQDQDAPAKVDLDSAISWLIDNNILSRDVTITVSNVKPNKIPEVSIEKYDVSQLKALSLTRTDLLMYAYKAVYGPINARTIAVETDNIRVDDGEYITLYDLMIKNGYNPDPNTHLPGSGLTTIPGSNGAAGGTGGGAGSKGGDGGEASGSDHQTNYLDDFGNWRYQPQGDLWESIFGDTNIFISQNNFQQQITGGNGGPGGGGGAGVGTGGTGGGGSVTNGNQDMMNNTSTGDNTEDSFDSHDQYTGGNAGNSGNASGSGTAGDYSENTGGGGGGGGAANTGDNYIDYDTDYKQIYFIPGADMLFYENNEVPEVYIQAALSRGLLGFESGLRTTKNDNPERSFESEFVEWPKNNPNMRQSWEKNSPAYVVNRSVNILKTVSKTEQVAMKEVLGNCWEVDWKNSTLTITRKNPFTCESGYFKSESVTKMDAYRYIYYFVYDAEKSLSDLERDIVNYKYGMELDGITNEADTDILKYLIAKGILCYDNTNELVELSRPISWMEFLPILRRTADKSARLDFSAIQLTDSETQWKAKGYAPQTQHLVAGEDLSTIQTMSVEEYYDSNFGTSEDDITMASAQSATFSSVASQVAADGTTFVRFGAASDDNSAGLIVGKTTYGGILNHGISTNFEGALYNSSSNNGDHLGALGNTGAEATEFDISAPSSNIAKYALHLLYEMRTMSTRDLSVEYPNDKDTSNPRFQMATNILRNLWAITDMNSSGSASEVESVIRAAIKYQETEKGQEFFAKEKNGEEYTTAVNALLVMYKLYCVPGSDSAPSAAQFMFYIGNYEQVTSDWVSATNGSVDTIINRISGLQFSVNDLDSGSPITLTYTNKAMESGATRGSLMQSDRDFVSAIGNTISCDVTTDLTPLVGEHWTEEMKQDAIRSYGNSISSFAALDSLHNTPDVLTYVDPDTQEAFIAWSTLERYKQSYETNGNHFALTRVSDYVLYNDQTQTYAYFSDKNSDPTKNVALVGTDVVTSSSQYGVVYRSEGEVYYLIDAVRLLLDAKQEAEILGGLRAMPLANRVVQENITTVPLDDNTGVNSISLTGITAMLSDADDKTSEKLRSDSVYFTKTDVYNNVRWGDFIAISTSNRAINATSRRFVYTTKEGVKKTAFAILIFDPIPANKIESVTVTPNSSLQDLLDAPQRAPETESGKATFENNMNLCNAFANWIYGTRGQQYISTGYLEPHAYIYAADEDVVGCMSEAQWGSLTAEQRALVEVVQLKSITSGAVVKLGSRLNSWTADSVRADIDHACGYLLSEDYRVCILGDRLYLNLGCFKNISTYMNAGKTILHTTGNLLGGAAFTVGSTFRVSDYSWWNALSDNKGTSVPTITVVETASDGMITCQVGPIIGLPILYDKRIPAVIKDYTSKSQTDKVFKDYDWESSEHDMVKYVYERMFSTGYVDIAYEGITTEPFLTSSTSRRYVFDGSSIWKMVDDGRTRVDLFLDYSKDAGTYMQTGSKLSAFQSSLSNDGSLKAKGFSLTGSNVETYFTVKFNAFYYTLENGVLKYAPNQASDFISPSLFTSLNDLIIDEMISAENGAIPVEEIPFGSLLEIGRGYYAATGTSAEDISFVGYAPLDFGTMGMRSATVQDVASSFATQFIRIGSQSVNVSHFFDRIEVLPSFGTDTQQASLNLVRDGKLVTNNHPKEAIFSSDAPMKDYNHDSISKGDTSEYTIYYAPVELTFQRGLLMAYQTSPLDTSPVVYELMPTAVSSVSGALSKLPFFSDNAMSGGLIDRTATTASGGFIRFYGATSLMNQIKSEFQKGFAGDLFTLARMLVFIVLIWLVVASWMCYATYFGGLMPILDAIRYPTGSRQGKGIDLMKIVSLGSITMETDFKLGRFIQYNLVLAALICVVYLTGVYL